MKAAFPSSKHCAYYGDVSATRLLVSRGASLHSRGDNFALNGAVFHAPQCERDY